MKIRVRWHRLWHSGPGGLWSAGGHSSLFVSGKKCLALGSVEEKSSSALYIVTCQQAGGNIGATGHPDTLGGQTSLLLPGFSAAPMPGSRARGREMDGRLWGEISTWVRRASLTSLGTHLIALGECNSQVRFLLHIRPSSWRQALPGAEGVTLGGGRKRSSCQILDVFVQSVC